MYRVSFTELTDILIGLSNANMSVLLTGPAGSGKSTVSNYLMNKQVKIIDLDSLGFVQKTDEHNQWLTDLNELKMIKDNYDIFCGISDNVIDVVETLSIDIVCQLHPHFELFTETMKKRSHNENDTFVDEWRKQSTWSENEMIQNTLRLQKEFKDNLTGVSLVLFEVINIDPTLLTADGRG